MGRQSVVNVDPELLMETRADRLSLKLKTKLKAFLSNLSEIVMRFSQIIISRYSASAYPGAVFATRLADGSLRQDTCDFLTMTYILKELTLAIEEMVIMTDHASCYRYSMPTAGAYCSD